MTEKETRWYNVMCSDEKGDYPVHIQWYYPLAIRLRKERSKERPEKDYWIAPYISQSKVTA